MFRIVLNDDKCFKGRKILRNSDFTMPHMIGYVSDIFFNMNIHVAMRGFRNYVQYEHDRCRRSDVPWINVSWFISRTEKFKIN